MALTYTAQLVDMLALRKPLSKSGLQGICKNMSTQTHVCSPFINDFWYMWVVGGGWWVVGGGWWVVGGGWWYVI
jgi:hypothetical protein